MPGKVKFSIRSKAFGGCNSVTLPSETAIDPLTRSGNTHSCCTPVAGTDCMGCDTGFIPQRWDIKLPAALSYGALPLSDTYSYTTSSGTCGAGTYTEETYDILREYYDIESLGTTLPCYKHDTTCTWSNSSAIWTGWERLDANIGNSCACTPAYAVKYGSEVIRNNISYSKFTTGTQNGVTVAAEIGDAPNLGNVIACSADPFGIPYNTVYQGNFLRGLAWKITPTSSLITVQFLWRFGGYTQRRIIDTSIPFFNDVSSPAPAMWNLWSSDAEFQSHGAQVFPAGTVLSDIQSSLGVITYTKGISCSEINGTEITLNITNAGKITQAAKWGITNLPSTITVRPFT